jgi:hypothetical protein
MNMSRLLTDEEMQACFALADEIGTLIDDQDYNTSMNALCLTIAYGGVQKKDMMTKREFVATVVETTDICYELALDVTKENPDD